MAGALEERPEIWQKYSLDRSREALTCSPQDILSKKKIFRENESFLQLQVITLPRPIHKMKAAVFMVL